MFVELFSDVIFVSFLALFYIVLVTLLFSKNKHKSRGKQWLTLYQNTQVPKQRFHFIRFITRSLRAAFSSSESEMQRKFMAAGFYNTHFAVYYMPIKYISLFAGGGIIYWLNEQQSWKITDLAVISALWLVAIGLMNSNLGR